MPNGAVTNYQWETNAGDFRLKQIQNLGAGSVAISKMDYVTDVLSRIRQWTQQVDTATPTRFDLGYNQVDELTAAVLKTDSTNAILSQYYYGYDAARNQISRQEDTTVKTYAFNNVNQLTASSFGGATRFKGTLNEPGSVNVGGQAAWMQGQTNFTADVNLAAGTNSVAVVSKDSNNNSRTNNYQVVVPSGGNTTFTYDANGNMTGDGVNTYSWDAAGRLVKTAYFGGASTEYTYDALGRRAKIVEKNSGGTPTSTKQFVFEGLNAAEQRDGSNAVTKRYYAEGWRDVAGSASYFYTKDHLGSIREVVDGSGALVSRYDYDPYGRTTKVSGTVDSDMLYTGHYYNASSGLYLTMYRAYNPFLARWLSRDPIGSFTSQMNAGMFGTASLDYYLMGISEPEMLPFGSNLYGYVGGNPVNYFDPEGEIAPLVVIGVGIVAGLAFDYAIDKIKNRNVGGSCPSAEGVPGAANAALGAGVAATGPFIGGKTHAVAGGGRAKDKTSAASKVNHGLSRMGVYPVGRRNIITKGLRTVGKYAPGVGIVIGAGQLLDAIFNPTPGCE